LFLISIIDDDAFALDGIAELVGSLGYRTAKFVSAEEFLASDALDETRCLITDLRMPRINRCELQDEVRRLGYGTPVIFLSAFADDNARARAVNGGAVAFLAKPFSEEQLVDAIGKAVTKTRQSRDFRK
jgi:FixJ family two-component response regulator